MSLRDSYGINSGDPTRPRVLEFVQGPPSWTIDAACVGTDPELFFPEKGGSTRDAKTLCTGRPETETLPARPACPVRQQCLEYALEHESGALAGTLRSYPSGIYGGLSERERRRILRPPTPSTDDADLEEPA